MRVAVIVALAAAVIVLAIIFLGGSSGHKYTLVFQNAGQLVPDNQVLIGGSPAGTVESIGLTDDNLAEINIEVDQELHEGTTAVIRATSLSGVANHYVAISPGPNSNEALEDGAWTLSGMDLDYVWQAPFRGGWARVKTPPTAPDVALTREFPPDRPLRGSVAPPFPKAHAVPFHYKNPVSGRVPPVLLP